MYQLGSRLIISCLRDSRAKLTKLQSIFSTESNNQAYRTALKSATAPYVTFIGIHTKDIVFAMDGNNDYLQPGVLNYGKFYSIWDMLKGISAGLREGYSVTPNVELVEWFAGKKMSVLDESQIFVWSKR